MLAQIEVQKAEPLDFKVVEKNGKERLKIGAVFYIADPENENHMRGAFVIDGKEDPYILKLLFEAELLYVPVENLHLLDYIKDE